ncbi:DgyrCDS400 [Dimorphilus gyrociliatus]|uniref:DgyrCDS400 n=1 Tax=Dimorphilus gyrociliatus TaxID=2664684 RepID=A0A7I8V6Z6_9ANNE|nr:DgyrCDS400 [Dimorphilus gyrociliatus]
MLKVDGIAEANSPATRLDTLLLEMGADVEKASEDNCALAFQTFDEILPQLGVYVRLMRRVRNILFTSVYSDQYTAKDNKIERTPFFTLLSKIHQEREERAEKLEKYVERLKKALLDKENEIISISNNIDNLHDRLAKSEDQIVQFEEELTQRRIDVESLEKTLEGEREEAKRVKEDLSSDIENLKAGLTEARDEVGNLQNYKMGYDELEQAFQVGSSIREKTGKSNASTRENLLLSNLDSAFKLEQQILQAENALIEDMDKTLEEHNERLVDTDYDVETGEVILSSKKEKFRMAIDEINTELILLRQHASVLNEELNRIQQKNERPKLSSQSNRSKSKLTVGLVDPEEVKKDDPFIANERVLGKYSAVIYTSDNEGKHFHELKGVDFCKNCGQKVVLCPHRATGAPTPLVVELPPKTTHIKIVRPILKLDRRRQLQMTKDRPGTTATDFDLENMSTYSRSKAPSMGSIQPRQSPSVSMVSVAESAGMQHYSSQILLHPMQRVWDDFKSRTSLERQVPRPLNLQRTKSMLKSFSAYILRQDAEENATGYWCVLDTLYRYMFDRYSKADVAYLSAYDWLAALIEFSASDKFMSLFLHTLVGNLDASSFRYVLLINDLLSNFIWSKVEDVRHLAVVLYPTLTDDELDQVVMGYTSWSENKTSASLISDYIINIILKWREPRFVETHSRLQLYVDETEVVDEIRFGEACNTMIGSCDERIRKRLYQEALEFAESKDNVKGGVPIQKLAQVISYLELIQIFGETGENDIHSYLSKYLPETDEPSCLITYSTCLEMASKLYTNQ